MPGFAPSIQSAASGGIDPVSLLLSAGSGVAGGVAGAISNANNRKRQQQLEREALQATRDSNTLDVAKSESAMDPFRQQLAQGNALFSLDKLERASYKPVTMSAPSRYAGSVPHLFGGASYEKSPELTQAAGMLKKNVLGGNVAPSMTDPTNYGKTAALNILQILAQGADPGAVSAAGGAPKTTDAYTTGMPTREAGGMGTSETRGTDYSVQQASSVLDRAIRSELGRAPNPGEIESLLRAQGLKPGDRWVGSAGLNGLLQGLRAQASAGQPAAPSLTGRG